MSADSSWPLQQAIYAALVAAPAIKALAGDPARVFDDVPETAAFPLISIGDATGADWSSKTTDGLEATITLHVWSRQRGRREVKVILDAVHGVLHNAALSVAGHALALLQFEFAEDFLDEDGLTRHGVARYRALTEKV